MRTNRLQSRSGRWLKVSLGGKLSAVTADVSRTGFCAELGPVFLPGSKVHGTIQVKDQLFPFQGKVTWARPGVPAEGIRSRIGVQFTEITSEFGSLFTRELWSIGM